jgi:predicted metal-dependent peptidase
MRYNKRYGLVFPGYRLDRKSRILFAIDSSGSMSDEDINKGCAILHNFLKKCDIDVAFWDAKMIDPFKFNKNITKIEAPGRGGTDPHCVGEYLDEHKKLHYDGVILFTDCIWNWKENNLKAPVFIISSEEKYSVPSFVKHHTTIQALTHCFD